MVDMLRFRNKLQTKGLCIQNKVYREEETIP